MKTAAELADMTDEAFDRWLKRNGFAGMAAVNLSAKRRAELKRRAVKSYSPFSDSPEHHAGFA